MRRTSRQRIEIVLSGRVPQRGLDATTISTRAKTALGTTRTILSTLQVEGIVTVVGTRTLGTTGRPANLYALAA